MGDFNAILSPEDKRSPYTNVKVWNRNVYGFLGTRKWHLKRALSNIQKAFDHFPSSHLAKKDMDVRDELENVLEHEDLLWRDWCFDQDMLQSTAVEFFERLYGEALPILSSSSNSDFPSLTLLEVNFLEKAITNEEIKKALFDMAPLKAPGSDRFHAHFFQSQWDTFREDVCQWNGVPTRKFKPVRGIHQSCHLSPYLFVLCMEDLGNSIQANRDAGHRISVRKSNIYFSKSTDGGVRNQISQMFGFQEVQNLDTYLGITLLHERVTSSTLTFIVEKDSICLPRARGGLGFRHFNDQNNSFLMKIGFSLTSQSNALWVRVLHSKYGWKDRLLDSISRNHCLHLWNSLSKIWPTLWDNLIWSIGDGALARCWKDPWILGIGSLISKIPFFSNLDLDCCVKEFANLDGSWNLDLFRIWLSEDVICRITSIPPLYLDSGQDRVIWTQSASRTFSRVRVFLWLALKNRLLTNAKRTRRGIGHNSSCPLYGYEFEDLAHVLRDCPFAKDRFWARCYRGVVKDQDENWIVGYTRFLGVCSPFEAEVWSILDGLLTFLNKGYRRATILTDNVEVAQNMMDLSLEDSGIGVLRRTQPIMKVEGNWKVKHILRSQNLVAGRLAKLSLSWKTSLQILNEAPEEISVLLQEENDNG
ncbi:hypothetical protein J1N35_036615 [Gossypium stocksii]|uniref:Reverse transcriptase zinc-binding domain-containing protein n=1 Tax=Gossypium stocksii TaxID=47602 RepID=A0A9D3UI83_9ROSI|nr:hypothetical protein J1N35_036615 [Gossypium stocksii]